MALVPAPLPGHGTTAPTNRVTVAEVSAIIGAPCPFGGSTEVKGVSDDSRTVRRGDLYLAFRGSHAHGLAFEHEAVRRGAVAVLSDRPAARLPTIVVPDPRRWAGPVTAHVNGHPSTAMDVYGVTGTNGKTSTTCLLAAGLTATDETVGTVTGISIAGPRSMIHSDRTTPEAALLQRSLARFRDEGATSVAMEVSSHAIAQGRIDGTRFAAVCFTNLARDHLDFHGSMDDYFAVKSQLFTSDRTDVAAIGLDDSYGARLVDSVAIPCWTWSTTDTRADLYADSVDCTMTGTRFIARTPNGHFAVRLSLLGPHQVGNALAALTTLAAGGHDVESAAAGLEALPAVPGRLERVDDGTGTCVALVDYMHNTAGQRRLLPYLRTLTDGKLIVVIGATGDRDPGKRFPLGATAASLADVVIVTDESPYSEDPAAIRAAVAEGARAAQSATVVVEPDRRRAFATAVEVASKGDVIVVAGRGCDGRQVYGASVLQFDDRVELRTVLQGNAIES